MLVPACLTLFYVGYRIINYSYVVSAQFLKCAISKQIEGI